MNSSSRRVFVRNAGLAVGAALTGGRTGPTTLAQAKSRSTEGKGSALRGLLQQTGLVVIPECYSALTGLVVEAAGFKAAYCGGHAMGGMHLGIPDHGLITVSEMIELSSRIAQTISIPLIADADQAGETALTVHRAVKEFEKGGVAGIHIEDTVNPKHMGTGDFLQSISEMSARISTAADARSDPDFLIIARTDELYNGGLLREAIRRGVAYAEAGADVFMCLHMTPSQIDEIAGEVPIPLLDINQPVRVVSQTKLVMDIFTGHAVSAAAQIHDSMLRELKENGELPNLAQQRFPRDKYEQLMKDSEYTSLAKRWAARSR